MRVESVRIFSFSQLSTLNSQLLMNLSVLCVSAVNFIWSFRFSIITNKNFFSLLMAQNFSFMNGNNYFDLDEILTRGFLYSKAKLH